jgi:outer membrane receptor protein involved in Fe transport
MDTLRRSLAVLLGITVGLSAIVTQAQELAFEEIIVTAQKREQSLQDVPISVSVLTGDKIEEAGIDNLDDLALYVPNFSKGESGGGAILQMRGIASGSNPAYEQSVTLYMDDISLARGPLSRMPMMDLERVEVLRGPQNVLFGKNAIAGAISLVTAKPTDEFEGHCPTNSMGVWRFDTRNTAATTRTQAAATTKSNARRQLYVAPSPGKSATMPRRSSSLSTTG